MKRLVSQKGGDTDDVLGKTRANAFDTQNGNVRESTYSTGKKRRVERRNRTLHRLAQRRLFCGHMVNIPLIQGKVSAFHCDPVRRNTIRIISGKNLGMVPFLPLKLIPEYEEKRAVIRLLFQLEKK
jgi:hypothetical protein